MKKSNLAIRIMAVLVLHCFLVTQAGWAMPTNSQLRKVSDNDDRLLAARIRDVFGQHEIINEQLRVLLCKLDNMNSFIDQGLITLEEYEALLGLLQKGATTDEDYQEFLMLIRKLGRPVNELEATLGEDLQGLGIFDMDPEEWDEVWFDEEDLKHLRIADMPNQTNLGKTEAIEPEICYEHIGLRPGMVWIATKTTNFRDVSDVLEDRLHGIFEYLIICKEAKKLAARNPEKYGHFFNDDGTVNMEEVVKFRKENSYDSGFFFARCHKEAYRRSAEHLTIVANRVEKFLPKNHEVRFISANCAVKERSAELPSLAGVVKERLGTEGTASTDILLASQPADPAGQAGENEPLKVFSQEHFRAAAEEIVRGHLERVRNSQDVLGPNFAEPSYWVDLILSTVEGEFGEGGLQSGLEDLERKYPAGTEIPTVDICDTLLRHLPTFEGYSLATQIVSQVHREWIEGIKQKASSGFFPARFSDVESFRIFVGNLDEERVGAVLTKAINPILEEIRKLVLPGFTEIQTRASEGEAMSPARIAEILLANMPSTTETPDAVAEAAPDDEAARAARAEQVDEVDESAKRSFREEVDRLVNTATSDESIAMANARKLADLHLVEDLDRFHAKVFHQLTYVIHGLPLEEQMGEKDLFRYEQNIVLLCLLEDLWQAEIPEEKYEDCLAIRKHGTVKWWMSREHEEIERTVAYLRRAKNQIYEGAKEKIFTDYEEKALKVIKTTAGIVAHARAKKADEMLTPLLDNMKEVYLIEKGSKAEAFIPILRRRGHYCEFVITQAGETLTEAAERKAKEAMEKYGISEGGVIEFIYTGEVDRERLHAFAIEHKITISTPITSEQEFEDDDILKGEVMTILASPTSVPEAERAALQSVRAGLVGV